ncbi:hypothetical protein BH09MYX1_BH09MYX1_63130 [soil metagenome]
MRPVGCVVQQHEVRLSRPVKAYTRWLDRIPSEYRHNILGHDEPAPQIGVDPECLAMVKHFSSLVPMAQEARRRGDLLRLDQRALSIKQPWAELIALGKKKIEYRRSPSTGSPYPLSSSGSAVTSSGIPFSRAKSMI